jgi:hypothetical protein
MLLAFIHTEKTGGTTLNQVLRRNLFMRFADVRPLAPSSRRRFGAADFRAYRRLNPRLCAISGHAVRPGLDVGDGAAGVRYVTLLRDPAKRHVSQFLYFVRIGMRPDDFGKFLDEREFMNVQTRKIAGDAGPAAAAEMLDGMLAVGALEEFDAFMLRLADALKPMPFDPRYVTRNTGSADADRAAELLERHRARIDERNEDDWMLYRRALDEVIPRHSSRYRGDLQADLAEFRERNARFRLGLRDYADFAVRKLYYEPASGLVRWSNGMPAAGSY